VKFLKIFMSVLALAVVMASCTKDQNETSQPYEKGIEKASVIGTEGLNYVKLWAGQNIYVGTVSFNEKTIEGVTYLEVCYEIESPWLMTQFHFDIKDIAVNSQGLPQIGNFDYTGAFNPGVDGHCFLINLGEAGLECDVTYEAAAHAVVVKDDGIGGFISQTAWGEGTRFNAKKSWATKFQVAIDDCNDVTECTKEETAFGGLVRGEGNSWWYYFDAAGEATQPIYAGAENENSKIHVGNVTFDNGNFSIELIDDWRLQNVEHSVKAQGYDELPEHRPAAGLFTMYKGTNLSFSGNGSLFYVIHLDVEKVVPCP